jgi:hypothetical protein
MVVAQRYCFIGSFILDETITGLADKDIKSYGNHQNAKCYVKDIAQGLAQHPVGKVNLVKSFVPFFGGYCNQDTQHTQEQNGDTFYHEIRSSSRFS